MSARLTKKAREAFENIKKVDDEGHEYWTARELYRVLEYGEYGKFLPVARKAWYNCKNSGINPNDHFAPFSDMIIVGKGAERKVDNIKLSRYACYLIVLNADSTKTIVAQAKTYFAVQTRRAEILLDNIHLSEEERRRLLLRGEMKKHNAQLAGAAQKAGVVSNTDYAIFQNEGYKGLYGGLTSADIHERKGLGKSQNILDHMGSTELAANLFRATQTEEVLRNKNIKGKENANKIHKGVGIKVRNAIKNIGGTMPEDLPSVESIKKLERKEQKWLKSNNIEITDKED